jgi:hypothetical protein
VGGLLAPRDVAARFSIEAVVPSDVADAADAQAKAAAAGAQDQERQARGCAPGNPAWLPLGMHAPYKYVDAGVMASLLAHVSYT